VRKKLADWATNCPEYKVTAVEVCLVTNPSDWQKRRRDIAEQQEALLKQGEMVNAKVNCLQSMDIQHLIKMANNIASFFEAEPDTYKGAKGVADHLKNFWDLRVHSEILRYADE
jgi:NADH-dependent formate dehydrogenase delta subunit FdsD